MRKGILRARHQTASALSFVLLTFVVPAERYHILKLTRDNLDFLTLLFFSELDMWQPKWSGVCNLKCIQIVHDVMRIQRIVNSIFISLTIFTISRAAGLWCLHSSITIYHLPLSNIWQSKLDVLHALLQASPTLWEYQLFLYQSGDISQRKHQ